MSVKYMVYVAIFGQEYVDELYSRGQEFNKQEWAIGRESQLEKDVLKKVKAKIIRGEVDSPYADYAIAFTDRDIDEQIGLAYGKKTRTIRDYYETTSAYTDEEYERFQVLPFSHFRFAKTMGKQKIKVLELSLRQMDRNGGKPPSEKWLRSKFTNASNTDDTENMEAIMNFEDAVSQPMTQDRQYIPQPLFYLVTSAKRMFENAHQKLERIELPSEQKEHIIVCLLRIQETLDELSEVFDLELD